MTGRVLIVEDHPLVAIGLQLALTARGWDVEVRDGPTAAAVIEHAHQFQPQCVLLDIRLGEGVGSGMQVKEEDLRMDSVKKDEQDPECSTEEADPQTLASASISTELFPSRRGVQSRHGGNGHGHGNGSVTHKVELKRETLTMTAVQIARQKGYEGDPCAECKQFTMVRNGTCLKCETCGATSGCS